MTSVACSSDSRPAPDDSDGNNPSDDDIDDDNGDDDDADDDDRSAGDAGNSHVPTALDAGLDASAGEVFNRGEGPLPDPFGDVPTTMADAGVLAPSECSQDFSWGAGSTPSGLETVITDALLDVTPDGQHWLYSAAGGGPDGGTGLMLADLPGQPTLVSIPAGYDASLGASLSADGRRLLLVRADGDGFGLLERQSVNEEFGGDVAENAFMMLNQVALQSGLVFSHPQLSSDGSALYYVTSLDNSDINLAILNNAVWQFERQLNPDVLRALGAHKLLSGLSTDERTLFFFDEAEGQSFAVWRSRLDLPFLSPTVISTASNSTVYDVHVGEGCERLFYRSAGGKLLSAARQ